MSFMLTEHFSTAELTWSSTAARLGIDNTPGLLVLENLLTLAKGLEEIRRLLGVPIHIDSGYRCIRLNAAVGGAKNSAHTGGYAADFIAPAFGTPAKIVDTIVASDIQFDQLIQEGTWVHVSFDPRMRREVLLAHFGIAGTTYSKMG